MGWMQCVAPLLFLSCSMERGLTQQAPIHVRGQRFVHIPAHSVLVGREGTGVPLDEQPAFRQNVSAFYIATTEVTNAQFTEFLNDTKIDPRKAEFSLGYKGSSVRPTQIIYTGKRYRPALGREHHPVSTVSHHAAAAYCNWLDGRLPTEVEWVAAARGGQDTLYPWGEYQMDGYANVGRRWKGHMPTIPVGSLLPNGFGLYDVIGNVWEWTSSTYHPYQGTQPSDGKIRKVLRGGDWFADLKDVNLFTRYAIEQSVRGLLNGGVGMRCVLEQVP